MDSLEYFLLGGCSNVKKIPEFGKQMKNLILLNLNKTAIEQIPSSIGHAVGLRYLLLRKCKNLLYFPRAICNSKSLSLEKLDVIGCSKIDKLPGDMDHLEKLQVGPTMTEPLVGMKNLKDLKFTRNYDISTGFYDIAACGLDGKARDGWGLRRLFGLEKSRPGPPPCWRLVLSSLNRLCSLTKLSLKNCNLWQGDIPNDIGCLSFLVDLGLRGNNFVSLPESIIRLSKLQRLDLEGCKSLQKLPPLPSNRGLRVNLDNCTSLRRLSGPSNFYGGSVTCQNCIALVPDEDLINRFLKSVIQGLKIVIPGSEIPKWFNNQSVGDSINVELPPPSCTNLLGIAFCVVFQYQDPLQNVNVELPDWYQIRIHGSVELSLEELDPEFRGTKFLSSLVSENLWVCYFPRQYCLPLEDCHQEQFLFGIDFGRELEADLYKVKKCGARLVYEQDLKELNQKLLKRTCEYRDEAAPSGPRSASFNNTEQIRKRSCN